MPFIELSAIPAPLTLTFGKLDQPARQLLQLCAWFAPEPLPERLFREHPALLPEPLQAAAGDEHAWNEAIAQLENHALLQRTLIPTLDRQADAFHKEPVFTLQRISPQALSAMRANHGAYCELAVTLLRSAYPDDTTLPANWPTCAALLPHVRQLRDVCPQDGGNARALFWLLDRAATYLRHGPALYGEARELLEAALELARATLGVTCPTPSKA